MVIPSRCLTYPRKRTGRAVPALCPGRVLLARIPLGQAPSLHPLRGWVAAVRPVRRRPLGCLRRFHLRARVGSAIATLSAAPVLVRGLRRYYGPVRLPIPVHHRRASLDFPTRPVTPSVTGEDGISRFPREVVPHVLGVFDRAGSRNASRWRRPGCCLPPSPTASAPRSEFLSRLNTRPARTPVNASSRPRGLPRMTRGRRGSLTLRTYDSFIHNTSPI